MGNAWAQPLCSVGGHLARHDAVTGAGFDLLFYKKKRGFEVISTVLVCHRRVQRMRGARWGNRRMCSAQVEQIHRVTP